MDRAAAADFVREVARHLDSFGEARYQDQLDVFLLGATVPAEPVRYPNPDCRDCWGEGWVCVCHGWARSYRRDGPHTKFERCPCWRKVLREAAEVA